MRTLTVCMLLGGLAGPVLAQNCDSGVPATAPLSRFQMTGDGTVIDGKRGQVWLRCALGMSWNGSTCEGQTLTYDWNSAHAALDELNAKKIGGHGNWRLPTQAELQGIVEQRCFKPAIDLDAFPYTPESGFWTATEAAGVNPRAMIIHFIHGREYVANKAQNWRVRPVADK